MLKQIIGISVLSLMSAASALATPILSLDFGTRTSPVEAGFTAMTQAGGTVGSIGIAITGTPTLTTIDRGNYAGAGTSKALFRDFLYSNESNTNTINTVNIQISGLSANALFVLELWSGDTGHNLVSSTRFDVGAAFQTVTNSTGFPTGLDDAAYKATFLNVTSDGLGNLQLIKATDGPLDALGQPPRVNGLRLTQIPEPGTLALLGLGLVGFGFSRRKKA